MRVAFWDLETTSLDAEFGQLLCGVIGEYRANAPCNPELSTFTLQNYTEDRWNDSALAFEIRDALEKYDLVIGYNSSRFDLPFLNTRLVEVGSRSTRIKRHKDLLYVMRGKYRLGSNRLARVTQFLFGATQKTSIEPRIWRQAICGHKASYEYIVKHCQLDVVELARVWDAVKDNCGALK